MGAALWIAMAGCEPPPKPAPDPPRCDGVQQDGEEYVDAPWDVDVDGYYDGAEPDCAAAYDPDVLDCDDGDFAVSPGVAEAACNGVDDDCNGETPDGEDRDHDGAVNCDDCDDDDPRRTPANNEVCWDDLDNDCDGLVDPGCGEDYNGLFALDVPVVYGCSLLTIPLVDIDIETVTVLWVPPYASMVTNETSQPGTLNGEIAPDGSFVLEAAVVLGTALACDEYYRISGSFAGPDRFEGTFEAVFDGACLSCENQVVPGLVGVRVK